MKIIKISNQILHISNTTLLSGYLPIIYTEGAGVCFFVLEVGEAYHVVMQTLWTVLAAIRATASAIMTVK